MKFRNKLIALVTLCLLFTPIVSANNSVHADAEPQFNEKSLSHDTWHQTPAAHNINDVKILKFNSKAPIGVGDYEVLINGHKFNAAGDSPLGKQIKAHQKSVKKQQAKLKAEQVKQQKEQQRKQQQKLQRAKKRAQQRAKAKRDQKASKQHADKSYKGHHSHYGLIATGVVIVIVLLGIVAGVVSKHRKH